MVSRSIVPHKINHVFVIWEVSWPDVRSCVVSVMFTFPRLGSRPNLVSKT